MNSEYYTVRLGALNRFNGPAEYLFPNRKAAIKFATLSSAATPGRVVIVRDPRGRVIKRHGKRRALAKKVA